MNKIGKSIFESSFDSFDFDDGFLSKIDAEVKKKENRNLEIITESSNKSSDKNVDKKQTNFYNWSLNAQDLKESDFADFDVQLSKIDDNEVKNGFLGLSPIQGNRPSVGRNQSFSSTPLRINSSTIETKPTEKEKNSNEFDYLEADLFEDWDQEDFMINKKEEEKDEDYITLSQAFKILEEAELDKKNKKLKKIKDEDEQINQSLNLLTGEGSNKDELQIAGGFSDESINVSNIEPVEKSTLRNNNNSSSVKPQVAQKLNFDCENITKNDYEFGIEEIYLSSDDDLDAFINVKAKKTLQPSQVDKKEENNVFSDDSFDLTKIKKGGRRVIKSDEEESSSPKLSKEKQKKRKKWRKNSQVRLFIESEAEVSFDSSVSCDETEEEEEDEEYEKSFVDEASYFSENYSNDMTSKYLESVKNVGGRAGNFKIPKPKPYIPANVLSQMPEESNTDYEIDSFCVEDVEEEPKTELSELEIVEKILEMDEKMKRKKQKRLKK